ncbi:hypothetical protein PYW07_006805 [Mythimna separata]|uniref:Phospholipid scramblase n=1 Tax=Mythimna separata TaxID=271217 RepID=A0AAD7Z104_MYTSE|nr:hypothetical protein PYW07_006805 [Mythimna separata]
MADTLPLVAEPALQRLSQQTTLYLQQTSSGYNGSNFSVFGEDEELILNLNEIVPDTFFRGGARRPFQFNGEDSAGKKLFTFGRAKSRWIIKNKVELFMDDALISVVRLARTCCTPIFNISDGLDNPMFRLKGRAANISYFQLQTNDKIAIGEIQKKSRGWKKEMFSFKDNYVISVPEDLAVNLKIAVLAACVYIDFRFHEGR